MRHDDPAPGILIEERLSRSVIGAFYAVYRELGFGYRERIYSLALERELAAKGHRVDREVGVMVYYRGEPLARQTLDLIVGDTIVVEIKAGERLHPDTSLQLFGYLCATQLELGLIFHFGREPKFHRVLCENHLKHRNRPRDTNHLVQITTAPQVGSPSKRNGRGTSEL